VDRPAEPTGGHAFQDRTVDVTTHREEPVVEKQTRVKEEVVVHKEAGERTETVRDNVRRTQVEVDDPRAGSAGVAPTTTPARR
jgi:stress response protein YsnF